MLLVIGSVRNVKAAPLVRSVLVLLARRKLGPAAFKWCFRYEVVLDTMQFLNYREDISCLNWQLWQYLTCMQLYIVDYKDKLCIVGDPALCLHLQSMASDYKVIHSATFHYHLRVVDSSKFTAESQPMTFILYPLWPSCIMHSQDAQLCAFLLPSRRRQHS